MRVLIDASNINDGGGVNHLFELLNATRPDRDNISHITILGGQKTLGKLPRYPFLTLMSDLALATNPIKRAFWLKKNISRQVSKSRSQLLFAPGGIIHPCAVPRVTMSRNLLPFDLTAIRQFGGSLMALKMAALRLVQTKSFRNADGLIFLTDFAANTVLKHTGAINAKTAVIPHGVSSRFYTPTREEPCSSYKIVYVSRVEPYKHHIEVLTAISQLHEEGYDIQLRLVGQARKTQATKLQRLIGKLNASKPFIVFNQDLDSREIPGILATSDIGLFASSCENMPNTLLEYMAAALPIACSNRGPMPEVLREAGIFFDPASPQSIKSAVKALLDDKNQCNRLSRAAHDRALEFTWEQCAERTWSFLGTFV
jgi:glycosyltransferase involved in cell wall biosynthesis